MHQNARGWLTKAQTASRCYAMKMIHILMRRMPENGWRPTERPLSSHALQALTTVFSQWLGSYQDGLQRTIWGQTGNRAQKKEKKRTQNKT